VFVAISASGGTRDVVEAARRHLGMSRVIAVTNREDSALAQSADVVLPLFAGEERSGVATRSFRATLAVLGLLADCWLTEPAFGTVSACVDALSLVLGSKDRWLAEACDRLDGARAIDVLADATDLGLAEQAALMLREGPRLPAVVYETTDWLHTGVYLAFPGHRALLFAGSAADREVVRTIRGRGGDTVVVGPRIDGATPSIAIETAGTGVGRAIVESVVAELLAAELWGRTEATDKGA
jgi:fructoselysine-6-P-deglycase FrlB-like protein